MSGSEYGDDVHGLADDDPERAGLRERAGYVRGAGGVQVQGRQAEEVAGQRSSGLVPAVVRDSGFGSMATGHTKVPVQSKGRTEKRALGRRCAHPEAGEEQIGDGKKRLTTCGCGRRAPLGRM